MLSQAMKELGHLESENGALTAVVKASLTAAGIKFAPNTQTPPYWGAAFIAYVAQSTGRPVPDNAAEPASWMAWGARLVEAAEDSVVLISDHGRQDIGIVTSVNGQRVQVVKVHAGHIAVVGIEKAQIFAVRKPPAGGRATSPPAAVEVPDSAAPAVVEAPKPAMWARLQPEGIEIIHSATVSGDQANVVPATYADTAPSSGHVMTSETPILQADNTVAVMRTWAEPPPVEIPTTAPMPPMPPMPAAPTLDMAMVLRHLEEINEAKAFVPGADPARFPLLAALAARENLTLELAAVRVIDSLAQIKGAA